MLFPILPATRLIATTATASSRLLLKPWIRLATVAQSDHALLLAQTVDRRLTGAPATVHFGRLLLSLKYLYRVKASLRARHAEHHPSAVRLKVA